MAVLVTLLILSACTLHVEGERTSKKKSKHALSARGGTVPLYSEKKCGEPNCTDWCEDLPFPSKDTKITFFYAEWCPCAQQIFNLLLGLNKLEAWFARVELKCISNLADKGKGKEYALSGLIDPNHYGASSSNCKPWYANRDAEHPYGTNSVWKELGKIDQFNQYVFAKEKAKDPSMKYHMHPAIVIERELQADKKYVGTPVIMGWLQKHSEEI
mmetsp:Transcript_103224/g.205172  ORF Transcript_103224/g.205172 Transcript_103224/m.205172 type:complete len:214 (+) Transcript_103224:114-755(+)|eukprot:CAMPEP_0172671986 /NCGR_PEP_ID=MMETSP1074-20121228/11266_1 /TAXON_ID=2916 /ORGANISM="Ceratium fusus, Strain PA161109" /LENGTH=213 /DNA_ID=CAMNT_0013489109 /DNA_START=77 /DNA_END=718 /DNA_ORIENTATION=+